ncbi:MAG: HEAT repeat domain-containing protein, partial [Planctomycetota bacterium]
YYFYVLETTTGLLSRLAWLAGKFDDSKSLERLLSAQPEEKHFASVRRAAIEALAECKLTKKTLTSIEAYADDKDAVIRQLAVEILAKNDASRAAKLSETFVSDRRIFNRLATYDDVDTTAAAVAVANHPQYQAVALPQLVAGTEIQQLADVAIDNDLADGVRLGAIEGLARIGNTEVYEHLATIGADETVDEELRKAAWRGLRRAKRMAEVSKS